MDNHGEKRLIMIWENIAFINISGGRYGSISSHAQLPTPLLLDENLVRVYFATRDGLGFSHISYMDLKFDRNYQSISVHNYARSPIITPGEIGTFDQHGVYPSSIIRHDKKYYLYYIGWEKGIQPPIFHASIGLAISNDATKFTKFSKGPILSRSDSDPTLVTSPFVEKSDNGWNMFYTSGIRWEKLINGGFQSFYDLKFASGSTLYDFKQTGESIIRLKKDETNIARPCIIREIDNSTHMLFSFVKKNSGLYQIGYALLSSKSQWERDDQKIQFIKVPDNLQTRSYPSSINMGDTRLLFYNGENYGNKGFYVDKLSN